MVNSVGSGHAGKDTPPPQSFHSAGENTGRAPEPVLVLHMARGKILNAADLAGIVPQSNLSAILAGKRKISATLAGKLARYFNVSPAVFVPA